MSVIIFDEDGNIKTVTEEYYNYWKDQPTSYQSQPNQKQQQQQQQQQPSLIGCTMGRNCPPYQSPKQSFIPQQSSTPFNFFPPNNPPSNSTMQIIFREGERIQNAIGLRGIIISGPNNNYYRVRFDNGFEDNVPIQFLSRI